MPAILGKTGSKPVPIHVDRLVQSRLLLQANSGAGKSWALRRLLEQTHGQVQHIVLDVEDEFHTLREKYDYVLAGRQGGDCPANVRCAAMLACRLLELNVSAVVGIYELKRHEQYRFVKLFLDSLVSAPRDLWHSALVVVDEAHIFCPQNGNAESASSVIDLMTRGRKRGFCGVLATQRISKLHKDAAAEANNLLIGRCALDVDMKRAADTLGWTDRKHMHLLRALKPGEFYSFGIALSEQMTKVKVGPVKTTHPRAGERSAPVTPPRGHIRRVLAQLSSLPEEAKKAAQTVAELQQELILAKRELAKKAPAFDPAKAKELQDQAAAQERTKWVAQLKKLLDSLRNVLEVRQQKHELESKSIQGLIDEVDKGLAAMEHAKRVGGIEKPIPQKVFHLEPVHRLGVMASDYASTKSTEKSTGKLGRCETAILSVLAQYESRTRVQVALISGYSHKSGGFNNCISKLRTQGLLEGGADALRCTEQGAAAVAAVIKPLPEGGELLAYWSNHKAVGRCGAAILRALSTASGYRLTKEEVGEATGYSVMSGGFNNTLSKLRTLALISGSKELVLSQDLV